MGWDTLLISAKKIISNYEQLRSVEICRKGFCGATEGWSVIDCSLFHYKDNDDDNDDKQDVASSFNRPIEETFGTNTL